MTSHRRLGVLGGTLDPVHYGHLDAAAAAAVTLSLDEVWLIPSHDPPHRPEDPVASSFHRFAMAALAVVDRPGYRACDLELRRPGHSYTIDTLRELHTIGWAPAQIFFIIGVDAFADIHAWRAFPAVLDAANFAVISRASRSAESAVRIRPDLATRLAHRVDAGLARHTSILPVEARTRDVSSTRIRERLRHHERIDDLVPAAVERHIMAHNLYSVGRQLA